MPAVPGRRPGTLASAGARALSPLSGLASQVLNAGTNVATAYIASLVLHPAEFGSFALSYGGVTLILATGRGLIGNPVLTQLPVTSEAGRGALVRSAFGFTLLVGAGLAAVLVVASPWLPALVWFAPWVVVALVQDVGRYVLLAVGRRGAALVMDAACAVTQGVVLGSWWLAGGALSVPVLAAGWGLGALAGTLAFLPLRRDWARPAGPGAWVRTSRDVAGWFSANAVLGALEVYLVIVLAGTLVGRAEAGGIRAVQLLAYQPAMVLLGSLQTLLVPAVSRCGRDAARLRRLYRRSVLVTAPVGVLMLAVAAAAHPLMAFLFGQYVAFAPLVLPVAIQSASWALAVPAVALLIGTRRGRPAFGMQVLRIVLIVGGVVAGALLAGASGVAWALAAGGCAVLVALTAVALRLTGSGGPRMPARVRKRRSVRTSGSAPR